ncbi:MAG: uracil-DNA glycosylase [Ruminococcaceae bacterium]|nr:uracil-DNA glycosylase [Oscillospiraceae bacterium]
MDWNELEDACLACEKCPLCKTRTKVVIGIGNRNADIMFVGEAPGADEDKQGIPFVGAAGKHLDKFLASLGINRDDVYIANILKCRPPQNRDPLPEEQDVCIAYLREQVKLIKPKIIVCLGRIAAMRLIDPEFRITKMHGKIYKRGAFYISAVYHPSALLRDPSKNEDMYKDLKAIKKLLKEIS